MKKVFLFLFCLLLSIFAFGAGWVNNYLYVYHYEESRAPTATENDMNQFFIDNLVVVQDFPTQFYWFDTNTKTIYDYTGGPNGSLTWAQRGYIPESLAFSTFTPTVSTAYQLSTTRNTLISCPVGIQLNSLLIGSASATVYLDYADDNTFSTNLVTIYQGTSSINGALNFSESSTVSLTGVIPISKYIRERSSTSGTVTITPKACQTVQL